MVAKSSRGCALHLITPQNSPKKAREKLGEIVKRNGKNSFLQNHPDLVLMITSGDARKSKEIRKFDRRKKLKITWTSRS